MPTRSNLQDPATKQDVQNLKEDIQKLDQKIDQEIEDLAIMIQHTMSSKEDLKHLEQRLMVVEITMATKDDLHSLEERMNEKIDRLLQGNDQVVQLLQKMDQEVVFTIHRVDRLEEHLGLRSSVK